MHFVCLFETFFDCPILINDGSWQILGNSFVRADHESNTKRCAVLLYYKGLTNKYQSN